MKNLFLLTLFLLTACRETDFTITNLNDNQITVLGHAGMGIAHLYPINSLESIKNCISIGAAGTELDVQMTQDSVLVAFHDESLEHSTSAEGQVFTKNWEDIKDATYNSPPFAGYEVVNLDELFSNIDNPSQYTFFLDCKNFNPDNSVEYLNTFSNALFKLIDSYQLDKVHIELRRPDVMQTIKRKRPELSIFTVNDFDPARYLVNEYQLQGISISIDKITKAQVAQAHAEGILIAAYRTRTKTKNIEAIEKNVDFIQSDKLKHLVRILE